MRENDFQAGLIKRIKATFKGCMVLKNDSSYMQGIPDLLVLYGKKWAVLEAKRSANARRRPNQEHYVDKMNKMSFASFIFPENEEEVMQRLAKHFK